MMYFWPCWVFTAARTTLSCGAGASRHAGFTCCGVWAPGRTDFAAWGSRALGHRRAQQLWRLGSALQHVGSSRIRMEAVCPGLGGGFFTTELPGKPRGTADGQNPPHTQWGRGNECGYRLTQVYTSHTGMCGISYTHLCDTTTATKATGTLRTSKRFPVSSVCACVCYKNT